MELRQEDEIKKIRGGFRHTIKMYYPKENVKNMKESWQKNVDEMEDWLNNYDSYLEDAKEQATLSFETGLKESKEEVTKVLSMTKEEQFDYFYKNFVKVVDELKVVEEKKDELIEKQYQDNVKMLEKYKMMHEQELKKKKDALKKWDV